MKYESPEMKISKFDRIFLLKESEIKTNSYDVSLSYTKIKQVQVNTK